MTLMIDPETGKVKNIKEGNEEKALAFGYIYKDPKTKQAKTNSSSTDVSPLIKYPSLLGKGITKGIGSLIDLPMLHLSLLKGLSKNKDQLSSLNRNEVEALSGFIPSGIVKSEDIQDNLGEKASKKILDNTLYKLVDKEKVKATTLPEKLTEEAGHALPFGAVGKFKNLKAILAGALSGKAAEELSESKNPLINIAASIPGAVIGDKINLKNIPKKLKSIGKSGAQLVGANLVGKLGASVGMPAASGVLAPIGISLYNVFSKRSQKYHNKIKNWTQKLLNSQSKTKELEEQIQQALNLPDEAKKPEIINNLVLKLNKHQELEKNLLNQIDKAKETTKKIKQEFSEKQNALKEKFKEIKGQDIDLSSPELRSDIKEAVVNAKESFKEYWEKEYNTLREKALKGKKEIELPSTSKAVEEKLKEAITVNDINLLLENPFFQGLHKIKKIQVPQTLLNEYQNIPDSFKKQIQAQLDGDEIKKTIEQAKKLTATPVQINETLRSLNNKTKGSHHIVGTVDKGILKNLTNHITEDIEKTYSPSLKALNKDIKARYSVYAEDQKKPLNELLKAILEDSNRSAIKLMDKTKEGKDIYNFLPNLTPEQSTSIKKLLRGHLFKESTPLKVQQSLSKIHPNVAKNILTSDETSLLKSLTEEQEKTLSNFLKNKEKNYKEIDSLTEQLKLSKKTSPKKEIEKLQLDSSKPLEIEKKITSASVPLSEEEINKTLEAISKWKNIKTQKESLEELIKKSKAPILKDMDNIKVWWKLLKKKPKKLRKESIDILKSLPQYAHVSAIPLVSKD